MLLVNFLWLFYLMVLVKGHTIHKSIDNDYKFDDIIDTNNIQDATGYRNKQGKFHHKYKRNGFNLARSDATRGFKEVQEFLEFISTTPKTHPYKIDKQHEKVTHSQKNEKKTPKSRKFWKKFHGKNKNEKNTDKKISKVGSKGGRNIKKSIFGHRKTTLMTTVRTEGERNVKVTPQYIEEDMSRGYSQLERRKKEMAENQIEKYATSINKATEKNFKDKGKKAEFEKLGQNTQLNKMKGNFPSTKTYAPLRSNNNLTTALSQLTNKVTELKKLYGLNHKTSFMELLPSKDTNNYKTTYIELLSTKTPKRTTVSRDYVESSGIAQIEALLGDIKQKEEEYISLQSPFITNLISNAVTEATFNLSTLYGPKVLNPSNNNSKRKRSTDFDFDLVNDYTFASDSTHTVSPKSIKEDTMIIAQGIEDKLQSELKSIYKKVKCRLSHDFRKEVNQTKTSVNDYVKKKSGKPLKKPSTTIMTTLPQLPISHPIPHMPIKHTITNKILLYPEKTSTETRKIRHQSTVQNKKKLQENQETSTVRTIPIVGDDYAMLSLYEQLLAKSNGDSIWKMLATQSMPAQRHLHNERLSKRNIETLADLSLKENVENIYNDGEEMPDEYLDTGKNREGKDSKDYYTAATSDDTSYEGLSNKISYNDYVNGYRYYLNFQNKKDQEEEKYSNLVRYQAHKHHKVDDIGKYILNKIPNVQSTKNKRRFVDSGTLEDQEISTKSEDSWFKKHFFVFIDKEPPKKFHSSETVSLKPQTFVTTSTIDFITAKKLDNEKARTTPSLKVMKNIQNENLKNNKAAPLINYDYEDYEGNNDILEDTNRLKRTPRHDVKFFDLQVTNSPVKIEKTKTAFPNANMLSKSALTSKKCGYVDVNMVHKPTAIVKLHDSKKKKYRLKGFLEKLHLRKKNKPKVEKREERRVRFNPVKKIKEIFSVKDDDMSSTIVDYEFVNLQYPKNSKPVKNPHQLINDLVHQIPNITEDRSYNLAKYDEKYIKNVIKEDNLGGDAHTSKIDAGKDFSFTFDNHKTTKQPLKTSFVQNTQGKAQKSKNHLKNDNIFNVNVQKIQSDSGATKTNLLQFDKTRAEIGNINDELDKIQIVLTTKEQTTSSTSSTIINTSSDRYTDLNENQEKQEDIPKELSVRTKLTRLAKYPMRAQRKSNIAFNDVPQIYEFVDNNGYLTVSHNSAATLMKPPLMDAKKEFVRSDKSANIASTASTDKVDEKMDGLKFRAFPDYFNDLILWHNDILNENVSPIFNNMLKPENSDSNNNESEDDVNNLRVDSETKTYTLVDLEDDLYRKSYKSSENHLKLVDDNKLFKVPRSTGNDESNFDKSITENIDFLTKIDENTDETNNFGLVVDTTILAYDDSFTLLEDKETKKMSKNSAQDDNNPDPEFKTLTKINPAPQQYYNTPLPMSNKDFEKFLRENQLDVNTVNAPMPQLPKIKPCDERNDFVSKITTKIFGGSDSVLKQNTNFEHKAQKLVINQKSKQLSAKLNDHNKQEGKINDNFQTEMNKNLLYTKIKPEYPRVRNRRFKKSNSYYDNNLKSRKFNEISYNKLKQLLTNVKNNDLSLEDLKAVTKKISNKKEVEVTVINFDDIDKAMANNAKSNLANLKSNKNEKATSNSINEMTTEANTNTEQKWLESGKNFFQNNLFHKHKDDLYATTEATKKTTVKITNPSNVLLAKDVKIISYTPKDNIEPSFSFNNLPVDKEPKSVHIASHTYRYDIVFNEPINQMNKEYQTALSSPVNFAKSAFNYKTMESEINRDDAPERKLGRGTKNRAGDTVKQRIVRKVTTTPFIQTSRESIGKGEFVFNLKGEENRNKQIQKRFKSLSGLLQELKKRMRNFSTTQGINTTTPMTKSSSLELYSEMTAVNNILKELENEKQDRKDNTEKDENNYYNRNDLEEVTGSTISQLTKNTNLLSSKNMLSTLRPISLTVRNKEEFLKPKLPPNIKKAVTKPLRASDKKIKKNIMKTTKSMAKDVKHTEKPQDKDAGLVVRLKLVPRDDKVSVNSNSNNEIKINVKTHEQSALKDESVDNDIYYEPVIEFKRKRKSKKEIEDKAKIENAVTPMNVTSDENILEELEKGKTIATLNILEAKTNMEYEDMQKKVPDEAYTNDDEIYYEPIVAPSKHVIEGKALSNEDGIKHGKRDVPVDEIHTAKDVAALEVVVDLMKNAPNPNDHNEFSVTPRFTTPHAVVMNKDVIATLMQMYNNMSKIKDNKTKREVNATENKPKSSKLKHVISNIQSKLRSKSKSKLRHIDWEAVKEYFGHDKVCDCHCKVNKTMCRACAASDAVMSELIFEFENMARYMNDHCTEIQTFFWMNPSGGRKLKNVVHNIEKTLDDYYKRVKGKCQGQACKTFIYMDKRDSQPSDIGYNTVSDSFVDDLETLANDLKKAVTYDTCNGKLFIKGRECLNEITKCIPIKLLNKRSTTNDQRNGKYVKQIYSLDNINVNIICKTESSTEDVINKYASTDMSHDVDSISFFRSPEELRRSMKKRKGLRRLFGKKNKNRKEYNIDNGVNTKPNIFRKSVKKRQIIGSNQIESPLIADSGGSFWNDYIKRETHKAPDVKKDQVNTRTTANTSNISNEKSNATVLSLKSSILNQSISENATKGVKLHNDDALLENKEFVTDSLTKDIEELSNILGLSSIHEASTTSSTKTIKKAAKNQYKPKSFKNINKNEKTPNKKINNRPGNVNKSRNLPQKGRINDRLKTSTKTLNTNKKSASKSSNFTKSTKPSLTKFKDNVSDTKPDKMVAKNKEMPKLKTKSSKVIDSKPSTEAMKTSKMTTLTETTPIYHTTEKNLFNRLKSITSKYLNKIPWHFRGTSTNVESTTISLNDIKLKSDNRIIRNPTTDPIETYTIEYMPDNHIGTTKKYITTDKIGKEFSTILIIDDIVNSNKATKPKGNCIDRNDYKNKNKIENQDLLLSVLNFESDHLNDEWDKYVKKKRAEEFFDYADNYYENTDSDFTVPTSDKTHMSSSEINKPFATTTLSMKTEKSPKLINKLLIKLSMKKSTTAATKSTTK